MNNLLHCRCAKVFSPKQLLKNANKKMRNNQPNKVTEAENKIKAKKSIFSPLKYAGRREQKMKKEQNSIRFLKIFLQKMKEKLTAK